MTVLGWDPAVSGSTNPDEYRAEDISWYRRAPRGHFQPHPRRSLRSGRAGLSFDTYPAPPYSLPRFLFHREVTQAMGVLSSQIRVTFAPPTPLVCDLTLDTATDPAHAGSYQYEALEQPGP